MASGSQAKPLFQQGGDKWVTKVACSCGAKKGHHFEISEPYQGSPVKKDCSCGAGAAFCNRVDDTNGDAYGYIKPQQLKAAVMCTCTCCKDTHEKERAIYEVPTTETPRFYYTSERGFDGEMEIKFVPINNG